MFQSQSECALLVTFDIFGVIYTYKEYNTNSIAAFENKIEPKRYITLNNPSEALLDTGVEDVLLPGLTFERFDCVQIEAFGCHRCSHVT